MIVRQRRLFLLGLLGVVAGCAAPPAAIAAAGGGVACEGRFRVVNNSSRTVLTLRFSHADRRDWGVDRLGQHVLHPGQIWQAATTEAGLHDFRITWLGGGAAELRRVDLCRLSHIIITDGGMFAR